VPTSSAEYTRDVQEFFGHGHDKDPAFVFAAPDFCGFRNLAVNTSCSRSHGYFPQRPRFCRQWRSSRAAVVLSPSIHVQEVKGLLGDVSLPGRARNAVRTEQDSPDAVAV